MICLCARASVRLAYTLGGWGVLVLLLLSVGLTSGCSSPQPFKKQESWLIRENARPHYFALYDIFYLSPSNYVGTGDFPYAAHGKALEETVNQFGVHTRVFAPIYHDAKDVEEAFEYYLDMYHGNGLPWPINEDDRPFVFIGEGEGAKLLSDFEQSQLRRLRRKGFLGGWYSPETKGGFVTDILAREVTDAVRAEVYKRTWGRDVQ